MVGLHDWGYFMDVRFCKRDGCTCSQTYSIENRRWVTW